MSSGRTQALVAPALIVWARKSAGFDVPAAAKKLKVGDSAIASWESGAARPSLAQLRKMAVLYKRPLAVFYLPEPPQGFTALRDFRTVAGEKQPSRSPRLEIETRRAQQRREAALDIAAAIGEEFPTFRVSTELAQDPVEAASRLRQTLGVPLEEQFGWKDQYQALNSWKRAVEHAGVLVFQTENLAIRDARGFSLALQPLPIVALNSKESPRGRVFTLFHELAHITLRASGVCDLHDQGSSAREIDRIEVFCNRVAGAALVPPASIAETLAALDLERETEWSDAALRILADYYSVSSDAALRSLVLAGRYPANAYAARHAAFLKAWGSERSKSGRVPYFRRALGWSGRRFARMALAAYDDQRISSADVTEYLRVKIKQVEQIRGALRKEDYAETA